MIEIIVPGEPQSQGRPRFNSYTRRAYDPEKSRDYKELVAWHAIPHKPAELWTDAIVVDLLVYRSAPNHIKNRKTGQPAIDYKEERLRPVTSPDVDNYGKSVLDACTGIIWKDDCQIVDLRVRKFYSAFPRAIIRIKQLSETYPRTLPKPEDEKEWTSRPLDWVDMRLTEWEEGLDGKK